MTPKLDRTVLLARLALAWEGLWAAAWPLCLVLALGVAAILSGLLAPLPGWARLALLAGFGLAALWALKPLYRLKRPGRMAALRRIERQTGLAHRPASSLDDAMADEQAEPASARIWEAHKLRQLGALNNLKVGLPRSDLKRLDPYALRLPALLILLASVVLHQGDAYSNLADAVRVAPAPPAAALALDAWIAPPAYTGKPPIMLTNPAGLERLAREGEVMAPENSVLMARVSGAKAPKLAFFELTDTGDTGSELKDVTATARPNGAAFQAEAKLARPLHVKVLDGASELASWRITLLPDAAPKVAFAAEPRAEVNGQLAVEWQASDDYGVAGLSSRIRLSDVQDGKVGIAGNGVFLYEPPHFAIGLKQAAPKAAKGKATNDLTAHPWAGLAVDMELEARDVAGKTGLSATKTFKLPERPFRKPLARALIEQRKALVMDPDEPEPVETMLAALLTYPDGLIEASGTHIAIRTVVSQLDRARSQDDIKSAVDFLWRIAVQLEDGDVTNARNALEALRKELEQALKDGAPPERIAELMKDLRAAMDRYMQALAAETMKEMRDGATQQRQEPGQTVSPQDLQKMLDMIEKLARNGANEAAQELLSQLEDILKRLQPGQTAETGQQDGALSQMLDELSELMRRQQQLMDDTTRLPESQMGDQQNGREPGSEGAQPNPGGLADQQQALGRMLEDLRRQLGQQGLRAPPSFGEAGKSMQGAEGALRQGERGQALGQQGEALRQLREGAQSMARQLSQQGQGQEGNYGRHGEARGDDRDPLGRPMPTRGEDYGPQRNMLPTEMAVRRAREILDLLRARANDGTRPRLERDYLDRLLRGLY